MHKEDIIVKMKESLKESELCTAVNVLLYDGKDMNSDVDTIRTS